MPVDYIHTWLQGEFSFDAAEKSRREQAIKER